MEAIFEVLSAWKGFLFHFLVPRNANPLPLVAAVYRLTDSRAELLQLM